MKCLNILSLLVVALMAFTSAQRCPGAPRNPSCQGPLNVGRSGKAVGIRRMWYWDARARQCRPMRYMGAGGNNNRWCTRAHCEQRCRR